MECGHFTDQTLLFGIHELKGFRVGKDIWDASISRPSSRVAGHGSKGYINFSIWTLWYLCISTCGTQTAYALSWWGFEKSHFRFGLATPAIKSVDLSKFSSNKNKISNGVSVTPFASLRPMRLWHYLLRLLMAAIADLEWLARV